MIQYQLWLVKNEEEVSLKVMDPATYTIIMRGLYYRNPPIKWHGVGCQNCWDATFCVVMLFHSGLLMYSLLISFI